MTPLAPAGFPILDCAIFDWLQRFKGGGAMRAAGHGLRSLGG
jgi:hypothetical protein